MRRAFPISISVLLLAAASFAGESVVEEIVARVNSNIITRSELQRSKEQAIAEARQQPNGDKKIPEIDKNILRDLIDQQLLVQKGQDMGLSADTEVIKQLDAMRKRANLETIEDLEKEAAKQGINWEDFKQNLKNNILTQMVVSREVGSHIQITAEDTRKFYEEHKNELAQPERVRLSEILVSTSKKDAEGKEVPMTPEEIAAAEAKARQLLEQVRKGAKFEDVARASSDGPTAAQGGDLGYFERGQLAKELEEKTFAMKAGETTDVVRTKQGFEILRVIEHTEAGIPSLKEVEPRVQEAIYMKRIQPALRDYLTKLREEAFIDIKPGFIDSGASPNQTKPIMTAANSTENAPAKVDEKKRKKKFLVF